MTRSAVLPGDAPDARRDALWPQVWNGQQLYNKRVAQCTSSERISHLRDTLNNEITLNHLLPHSNLGNLFLTSRKQGPVDVGSLMLVILLVICVSLPLCSSHGVPLRNKIQLILEEEMPEEKLSVAKGRRGESRVQNQTADVLDRSWTGP